MTECQTFELLNEELRQHSSTNEPGQSDRPELSPRELAVSITDTEVYFVSERWHQTLKNRILLENYFLPGDLEK
jgi:hypothetical protein